MIQLGANPSASRLNWRPAADDGKETSVVRRARSGHAWPFISRHAERAAVPQEPKRIPNSESGS
jgi:hypothetical protein